MEILWPLRALGSKRTLGMNTPGEKAKKMKKKRRELYREGKDKKLEIKTGMSYGKVQKFCIRQIERITLFLVFKYIHISVAYIDCV